MAAVKLTEMLSRHIILLLLFIVYAESKLCVRRVNNESQAFQCPRPNDSWELSECCDTSDGCCPPERHFYEIDNRLAIAISVSVSLTCLVITIIIIVCCFWSRCPLYSACRVQYTEGEIVYGKESENIAPSDASQEKKKLVNSQNNVISGDVV